ncbi:multi antimicrobial extrusion protein (Na(+)/drug antiporter) [Klebsiella pneumoniae]|uniref:Multi antimicrobial extrusion protein (Na(+)/drug antiporter) n=1 Tax=Klebsiella pneumoniae TaxID=573 RepID=A0A378ATG4_KLEPN|nr:multi antimicrobial extrusion protein (Na(+)/drug antiporter) [Klebsiella pneumoniae]
MALALPFVAISLLASEYYQAIGKPWYSVLLTLMRHVFISVPVVYLLAIVLEMRITGVYFGAMSGTFVAALLAWRLLRLSPRLLRWNQERCAPNTWIWRWHHDVGQSVVVATGTVPHH